MYPFGLHTRDPKTAPSFEIIDHKELRNRFPQNSSLLIVDLSHFDQLQSSAPNQQIPFFRKVYLVASSLPVVFAIDAFELQRNYSEWYLDQVVDHLRFLRRIRIIQSLKSKNVIMFNLSTRQGPALDKGRLEVSFCHPLLDSTIASETFQLSFCQNGAEVFCVLDLAQIHSQKHLPDLEFPGNCCTMKIKLTRRSYTRTFTSLVWFVERRFKNSRVYFCAVKTDKLTKVNFYFMPKQEAVEGQAPQTLVLSHIEIAIGSPSAERTHSSTSEFLQNIKKQEINQNSENYRFNLRPVDYAIAGLPRLEQDIGPNLQAASFHPNLVQKQPQARAAPADNTDSNRIEISSQRISGVPPAAQPEQATPPNKRQQTHPPELLREGQSFHNQNIVSLQHTSGKDSSEAAHKQTGFFRERHARTSVITMVSEPVEPRAQIESPIASINEYHTHPTPPNFEDAGVGEPKLMPTRKAPIGFAGPNQGSKDFSISTNSDKLKCTVSNPQRRQPDSKTDPPPARSKSIHQQSEDNSPSLHQTTSEQISHIFSNPSTSEAGQPQLALDQFLDADHPSATRSIWGN